MTECQRIWGMAIAVVMAAVLMNTPAEVLAKGRDRGRGQALQQRTLNVGGVERSYYLYVPTALRGAQAPLVVAFHGGGQDVERFAMGVGLQAMADRYGFVMAVPEGIQKSWNTGSPHPQGYAEENGVNDLAFVSALLDDVLALGVANPARVFAMGVSRGGMMTYHAACAMPSRFAAIAAVAGTLSSGICPNPQGVSLLHIHGTADERVPFEGGSGQFTAKGGSWMSAQQGIHIFAQNAQCSAHWQSKQVTADTTCYQSDCSQGDKVEYCLIQGGGHTWPGVATTKRQQRQGAVSSYSFNATDYIAEFFLRY